MKKTYSLVENEGGEILEIRQAGDMEMVIGNGDPNLE